MRSNAERATVEIVEEEFVQAVSEREVEKNHELDEKQKQQCYMVAPYGSFEQGDVPLRVMNAKISQ